MSDLLTASLNDTIDELEAVGKVARADFLFWVVRYEAERGHECPEVSMPHGWPILDRRPAPPVCERCLTKAIALKQIRAILKDPALRLAEWNDCPIDLAPWRTT